MKTFIERIKIIMEKLDRGSKDDADKLSPSAQLVISANSTSAPGAVESGKHPGFLKLFVEHWHAAITYWAMFWSFGMCVAFLGPTLLDLGCLTASDMRTMSSVFFFQLLFMLIGAFLASYIVQKYVILSVFDNRLIVLLYFFILNQGPGEPR